MSLLKTYTEFFDNILIRIVEFIAILVIGLVIGRFAGKLTYKILREFEVNKFLGKKLNLAVQIEKQAGKLVQYLIYLFVLIYALNKLGIKIKFFYYILVIIIFILLLYLILQIKDYIQNLFIGTFFMNKEFLKPGEKIKIKNIEGTIIKVTMTEIKLITNDNDVLFIPNTVLMKSQLFKKK